MTEHPRVSVEKFPNVRERARFGVTFAVEEEEDLPPFFKMPEETGCQTRKHQQYDGGKEVNARCRRRSKGSSVRIVCTVVLSTRQDGSCGVVIAFPQNANWRVCVNPTDRRTHHTTHSSSTYLPPPPPPPEDFVLTT